MKSENSSLIGDFNICDKGGRDKSWTVDQNQLSLRENDIYLCAADVLNEIIKKIVDDGEVAGSLDTLNICTSEAIDGDDASGEFVDALSNHDEELSPFFQNSHDQENPSEEKSAASVPVSPPSNNVDGAKLIDFSLNNSTSFDFDQEFARENIGDHQNNSLESSTPIDEHSFNKLIAPESLPLNEDSALDITRGSVENDSTSEYSSESFQTAVSTMSEDRPITSKGQYSLDFEKLMASEEAALEAVDPFGGRASSKNKTFTRKPKLNAGQEDPTSDSNANDVNRTPLATVTDESFEASTTKTPAEKAEELNGDTKNSNVEATKADVENIAPEPAKNENENANVKVAKAIDETPKRTKAEVAPKKVDKVIKNAGGRVPGAQQTAIVAPMVNTHAEQSASSGNCATAKAAPKAAPMTNGNPSTADATINSLNVSDVHSEDEFVMASSDLFADPSALDYLQNAGTNSVVDSELYRQSLYVKFDPLVAEKAAAESKAVQQAKKKPSAPTAAVERAPLTNGNASPATPNAAQLAKTNQSHDTLSHEEISSADDDLLMMKTPSPNVKATGETPVCPPTVVLKKKASPVARTGENVDNILAISPRRQDGEATPVETTSTAATQQMKMQFQAYILSKEKEWAIKFREERERAEKIFRENLALSERASTSERNTAEMKLVVAEYDKTIRDLMRQLDKNKVNKQHDDYDQVVKDKDQALEDLQSVENAFSELHRRYEKLRSSTEDFKKNEEKLRDCVVDLQNKLKMSEEKFRKLKEHAEEKLEAANVEIDKLQKAKESDTLALRALVKKRDLQVESLEKTLEQKQKEITELSSICDELIQKVDYPQNTKSDG